MTGETEKYERLLRSGRERLATVGTQRRPRPAPAPMGPQRRGARASLAVLTVLAVGVVAHATVVSGLQHRSAQVRKLAALRASLAVGTAPISDTDASGHGLAMGTPMALLQIPAAGIKEVVLEGTTSGVLMSGPGHRRGTPFPGQPGSSIVFGRRAAYGGPFKEIGSLPPGAKITVTTGQGVSIYKVIGVRRAGDPAPPPPAAGAGRLQLLTAAGTAFVPEGVLRVDADLVSDAFAGTPVGAGELPPAERPLGTDPSTAWALVLWLQALVALVAGTTWAWLRWGHHPTWIAFGPPMVLVALAAMGQFVRLLPNVL